MMQPSEKFQPVPSDDIDALEAEFLACITPKPKRQRSMAAPSSSKESSQVPVSNDRLMQLADAARPAPSSKEERLMQLAIAEERRAAKAAGKAKGKAKGSPKAKAAGKAKSSPKLKAAGKAKSSPKAEAKSSPKAEAKRSPKAKAKSSPAPPSYPEVEQFGPNDPDYPTIDLKIEDRAPGHRNRRHSRIYHPVRSYWKRHGFGHEHACDLAAAAATALMARLDAPDGEA